jgi:hypothetical protein
MLITNQISSRLAAAREKCVTISLHYYAVMTNPVQDHLVKRLNIALSAWDKISVDKKFAHKCANCLYHFKIPHAKQSWLLA